jgi:hypothetical protein
MKRVLRERVDGLLIQRGIKTLGELHLRIQEFQPGFAWQTLSLVVNGKRYPRLDTLDAIAQGLGTTIAYLIGEVDDPSPAIGSEVLPEVIGWSERLRALEEGQRALTVRLMEGALAAVENSSKPQ